MYSIEFKLLFSTFFKSIFLENINLKTTLYILYMDISEEPPGDFFKCVKVSLKHVLKHYEINQPKINNTAIKAHKIVIHTLQFMKLYLIDYYEKHNSIPVIDKEFINSCMKILCNEKANGRPPKKEIKELKDN